MAKTIKQSTLARKFIFTLIRLPNTIPCLTFEAVLGTQDLKSTENSNKNKNMKWLAQVNIDKF